MNGPGAIERLKFLIIRNAVPIIFIVFSACAIPLSGFSARHMIQELLIRVSRNSFLVLSLLIPIMAGMGLNFGMVLGAMAGQIGLIFITDWGIVGIPGMITAAVIGTPVAVFLGYVCGSVLNSAKGREMVTSYILGFFINGLYQFAVLYMTGNFIPIGNPLILRSTGYGVRNSIDLAGTRGVLDRLIDVRISGVQIPVATYMVIAVFCLIIVWFRRTKLGHDMRATGQDMAVASSAGIPVERTRVAAIIISTILACYGQIIFLQNIGVLNTYNAHEQAGMFAIASLLVGGASVSRARISNVFLGVLLFHTMFVVSPNAGKTLMGQAQLGEYFRVCVSYGIIAVAL
ncbi:MAG: ABC transporter permease, partial [Synergistaceae bacterium]|nr:ABC transporter permease [Synergistaceae bacterium]